jgi:putative SOS response-associated peptidase YedK
MKDGQPFGIGGLWENWKDPASSEWIRTFAVITTDANELVAEIHDRWLSEQPDPRDLLRPFPPELMRIWPISTRVNKPEHDEPSVLRASHVDRFCRLIGPWSLRPEVQHQ